MARRIASDAVPLVEHRGKTIKYIDPQWHCDELGISNVSLEAIKKAIDRDSKKERTLGVDVLVAEGGYSWSEATVRRAVVSVLATDGDCAFVKYENGDKEKVSVRYLVPIEHEAAAHAWCDRANEAKRLTKAAEETRDKLAHHTAESLRELADKLKAAAA